METTKTVQEPALSAGVQFNDELKQSSLSTAKIEKATRIMTLVRKKQQQAESK